MNHLLSLLYTPVTWMDGWIVYHKVTPKYQNEKEKNQHTYLHLHLVLLLERYQPGRFQFGGPQHYLALRDEAGRTLGNDLSRDDTE